MSKPGERERFEEWWQREMRDRMPGSKYLARKAWLAALWVYEVDTDKYGMVSRQKDDIPRKDK